MRFALLLLMLALAGHALEKNDVVGTWKGQLTEEPGIQMEIYFDAGGTMEMRTDGTILGIYSMRGTMRGEWRIQANDIWGRTTSGWVSLNGEPAESVEPDTGFTPSEAVLIPGNPKILRTTDCEVDPVDCVTQDYRFVSAGKQFTLPEAKPGTSIRRFAGKVEMRRSAGGLLGFRVTRNGRVFDLKGRSNPAEIR